MNRSIVGLLVLIALSFFISGCSPKLALKSKPRTPGGPVNYYLPKSLVQIKLYEVNGDFGLLLSDPLIVADESAGIELRYKHSGNFSDTLKVSMSPRGLLEKVEFSAEDKTQDIAIALVDIASAAQKVGAVYGILSEEPEAGLAYSTVLDPFSMTELNNVSNNLTRISGRNYKLTLQQSSQAVVRQSLGNVLQSGNSIYYRPLGSYQLVVSVDGNESFRQNIDLLDVNRISSVDVERLAAVKAVTNLTFTDGSLTELYMERPSQGLALAQIPVEVLKAIVAIPSELIQLKIDTSGKYKSLYEAQKTELEKKDELIKKQQELLGESVDDPLDTS